VDLAAIARIAVRQWYVLLPVLILAGGIGWFAAGLVPASYSATGILVVNAPYASDDAAMARLQANPYFETGTTASVVAGLAGSADVRDTVAKGGGTAGYMILQDSGRPVVSVTLTGSSGEQTLSTYQLLAKELSQRLDQLQTQKNIPTQYRVTVDDVQRPQEATAVTGSRTKVLIAALALGLVLGIVVTVYWDRRWSRRRGSAEGRQRVPAEDAYGDGRHPADDDLGLLGFEEEPTQRQLWPSPVPGGVLAGDEPDRLPVGAGAPRSASASQSGSGSRPSPATPHQPPAQQPGKPRSSGPRQPVTSAPSADEPADGGRDGEQAAPVGGPAGAPARGTQPGGTQLGGSQPNGTQPGGAQPNGAQPGARQPSGKQSNGKAAAPGRDGAAAKPGPSPARVTPATVSAGAKPSQSTTPAAGATTGKTGTSGTSGKPGGTSGKPGGSGAPGSVAWPSETGWPVEEREERRPRPAPPADAELTMPMSKVNVSSDAGQSDDDS
jgi:hypothetical protein